MKSSVLRFSMTVSSVFLLSLFLILSFSSCSKPNLGDIVREHIEAVNTDDVEKNLTLFADDAVFEIAVPEQYRQFYGKFAGKDQLRNLMEWDVGINARLTIGDMRVEGNAVIGRLTEKNEGWRLLGIDVPLMVTYEFRGRLLEKVKLEFSPESARLLAEKFKPFAEWAGSEHPQEFSQMAAAGYSAEGARLFLSLAKEWRDKTSTERVSAEQELIKLENEWGDAWVKRDVAFFEQIESDDYTWTSPSGEVWTKAKDLVFVKSLKPGKGVYSQVIAEMKVRVYGDAAVVTGRDIIKETHEGKEVSRQERWTNTWVKRDGRWQCVAGHSSLIEQK